MFENGKLNRTSGRNRRILQPSKKRANHKVGSLFSVLICSAQCRRGHSTEISARLRGALSTRDDVVDDRAGRRDGARVLELFEHLGFGRCFFLFGEGDQRLDPDFLVGAVSLAPSEMRRVTMSVNPTWACSESLSVAAGARSRVLRISTRALGRRQPASDTAYRTPTTKSLCIRTAIRPIPLRIGGLPRLA